MTELHTDDFPNKKSAYFMDVKQKRKSVHNINVIFRDYVLHPKHCVYVRPSNHIVRYKHKLTYINYDHWM